MSGHKGTLILNVLEASGMNKQDNYVWDHQNFNGWVKVELRGGPTNVKVQTQPVTLSGQSLIWKQVLQLEVAEGANELRLMLCKEKISADGRKGVSVIAACGIYVDQILDNVPIDKYFELFKPNGGGEGGYIRIGIDFTPSKQASPEGNIVLSSVSAPTTPHPGTALPAAASSSKETASALKRPGPLSFLVPGLLVVAGVVGLAVAKKRSSKKQ